MGLISGLIGRDGGRINHLASEVKQKEKIIQRLEPGEPGEPKETGQLREG